MKALLICIFLGLRVMTANTAVPPLSCLFSAACEYTPGWAPRFLCCFETNVRAEAPRRPSGWRGFVTTLQNTQQAWWHVSQYYISAADETHGPEKTRVTFLTVILFEFADVFIQEHVRILVVFCLQLKKLFFDQERSRGGGYKKKQKSNLRKRSHHYRNGDSHE